MGHLEWTKMQEVAEGGRSSPTGCQRTAGDGGLRIKEYAGQRFNDFGPERESGGGLGLGITPFRQE